MADLIENIEYFMTLESNQVVNSDDKQILVSSIQSSLDISELASAKEYLQDVDIEFSNTFENSVARKESKFSKTRRSTVRKQSVQDKVASAEMQV